MKKILILSILMVSQLFTQCTNEKAGQSNLPGPDDLSVSFLLHGNTNEGASVSNVEFLIENSGNRTLGNFGWTIYFNQFPRTIVPGSLGNEVNIEWIN